MSFEDWTNYPTCCVHLWLTYEEVSNECLYRLANSGETIYDKSPAAYGDYGSQHRSFI